MDFFGLEPYAVSVLRVQVVVARRTVRLELVVHEGVLAASADLCATTPVARWSLDAVLTDGRATSLLLKALATVASLNAVRADVRARVRHAGLLLAVQKRWPPHSLHCDLTFR